MKDDNSTPHPRLTRNRLIQLLNRDLACEYQAIIAYVLYSEVLRRASFTMLAEELERHAIDEFQHARGIARQIVYLGGIPCTFATAVKPAPDPLASSQTEPHNERPGVGQARSLVGAAGPFRDLDFCAALRAIIVPELEIAQAATLGMDTSTPPPPRATRSSVRRQPHALPQAAAPAVFARNRPPRNALKPSVRPTTPSGSRKRPSQQ